MPLLTFRDVSLSFGDQPLLDQVNFSIDPGERLCLIGRNGAGKSTLLKVIARELLPDDGQVVRSAGIKVAQLAQNVPQDIDGTVFDFVASGLGETGVLVRRYHELILKIATDPEAMQELERCQHQLESAGGWEINQRVETALTRLDLDGDVEVSALSGGIRRRVLLAAALVSEPDLLLLDEPTNHLDIQAIEWLEEYLLNWPGSLLFITHDRVFLRKLATRIIELDRGKLTDWPGDYDKYLLGKQQLLETEQKHNALFDKRLAQEEVWIRQGIKARRTRNEGRVRALEAMRRERGERREQQGAAIIGSQTARLSGKLVVEAEDLQFGFAGQTVVEQLTTTIMRGDKIGIIGPNGAGKTTLIKLLLGELTPDAGTIRLGTNLEIGYFDQYRSLIDDSKTVQDNVGDGSDTVMINGKARHVISYLQDFLFNPQRARQPAAVLSGGERNRLMLARLFSKPSNLLVLDEPTNDLDTDTLDLLEELLIDYPGTVLLVSHDRAFIDNVVTSTLVFEGQGVVNEYVGGYQDWLRQKARPEPAAKANQRKSDKPKDSGKSIDKKLSYNQQRELKELPKKIEALENEQTELTDAISDPAFYGQDKSAISATQLRLKNITDELESLYTRWEKLEAG